MKNLVVLFWMIVVAVTSTMLAAFINIGLGVGHPAFFILYGGATVTAVQLVYMKMEDAGSE
jgi:hypothetical protein